MLQLIEAIPQLVSAIPDLARTIADDLGPAFGVSVEQMEAAGSEMQTLLKLVIMLSAGFKAAHKAASESYGSIFENSGEFLKNLTDLGKQPILQLSEIIKVFQDLRNGEGLTEDTTTFVQDFKEAFDELAQTYDMFGESQKEAAEDADTFTTAAEQQAVAAQKLKDALTTANYKLTELKKTLEEEALTRSIQDQRDQIIEAIQQSRKREDIERNYSDRIQEIMESASESRTDLYENLAENEYDIEKDHQERLQDLLEDFTFEADELARKRDAVGLLSLIRSNKKQLSEEEESAEKRKQEARENFQDTLRDMDESLKEQLEKAYEARAKEYETMARNLQREKELKDLYDKWEEEDRQRKLDKTLTDMWTLFEGLDGMTKEGLDQLLSDWGTYYTNLANLINTQNAAISASGALSIKNTVAQSTKTSTQSTGTSQILQTGRGMTRNIGQSGLVSSLLINSLDVSRNLSRNVPVSPRESSDSNKNMHITVDGTGLDPYIQRVVVNTLSEIERNRG
jgi:DNA repair exonuclease SbcCD ATPase subunit